MSQTLAPESTPVEHDDSTDVARAPLTWKRIAFLVLACSAAVLHAMVIVLAFTHSPLSDDEGFNLTVATNVLAGDGYVSDGIYRAVTVENFDPTITTGPHLILPTAALIGLGTDVATAGHLVAVAYYLLLLVALALLGRRIAGPWGSVAAVFAPLILDLFRPEIGPVYGPGDLFGEYGATAFAILAILTARRSPLSSGILFGLAVLTKLVAAFTVGGLLVALWWAWGPRPTRSAFGAVARAAIGALIPLGLFEAVKLAIMGPAGYMTVVQAFVGKLGEQLIPTRMWDEKIAELLSAWFVPSLLVLLVLAMLFGSTVAVLTARSIEAPVRLRRQLLGDPAAMILAGVIAGLGTTASWLMLTFTLPQLVRHPAPGLIPAAAAIGAGAVLLTRALLASRIRAVRALAIVQASLLVAVSVGSAAVHEAASAGEHPYVSIEHQRTLADAIAATGTTRVQGVYGAMVPLAVLAGLPTSSIYDGIDPDALLVFDSYETSRNAADQQVLAELLCGTRVEPSTLSERQLVLCWPADDAQEVLTAATQGFDNREWASTAYDD